MRKLYDCPFCGSKPIYKKPTWWRLEYIRCSNGYCMSEISEYSGIDVIEAWNKRFYDIEIK